MNTAIIGVVPQPGATFPYSEFKGLNISPSLVLSAISYFCSVYIVYVYNSIIIKKTKFICI